MEAEPYSYGRKRQRRSMQQRVCSADAECQENSAVHALLMLLIAKGVMSGVLAHEIARATQEDLRKSREGIVFPDLEQLANLQQGRNLIRSVHEKLRRQSTLPQPVKIPMPYVDGLHEAEILLPHEWFAAMAEDEHNWRRTICPNEHRLPEFWSCFESHPAMFDHPMKRILSWKKKSFLCHVTATKCL